LPTKAATLATFTLNHSLPKEKQAKFLQQFNDIKVNYAYSTVTISRSENFFRTHDKILLFIIVLSKKKSVFACNSRYLLALFAAEGGHAREDFSKIGS
jgi:hypothetical protein